MDRAQLEAKLIEHPDDLDAYRVYADLLQSQGDPRGELIALELAGKTDELAAYFDEHKAELLGPLAPFAEALADGDYDAFNWKLGFIRWARLKWDFNEGPSDLQLGQVLGSLLAHPAAKLLQKLIVPYNMDDDGVYFEPIIAKLAEVGAPELRELRLGEFQIAGPGGVQNGYDYDISWSSLGDASALWRAVPKLERLRIQAGLGGTASGGASEVIGDFDLPNLKWLEVVTGGMNQACLQSFANAKLPALEHMDLWLGSDNYGASGTAEDLQPIFDGSGFPKLQHLGIMNSELGDAFAEALAASKILPQLRELDLSYGTLGDEGAEALAAHADRFRHLAKLDVSANCLTEAGEVQIGKLCAHAITGEQKDDDERYASLGE